MAEYIERDALIADLEKWHCKPCEAEGKDYNHIRCRACWVNDMVGEIGDAPFYDVSPVRHGRWEEADDGDGVVCSACREDFCNIYLETDRFNYCPNCGARMDLEVSE